MAEITKTVEIFIDKASKMVGKRVLEYFDIDAKTECIDLGMESPIEHLFYVAFNAVRDIDDHPKSDPMEVGNQCYVIGLGLFPQYKINKYRADFLGTFGRFRGNGEYLHKEVIVECDSQQFHERTETERRYEKARDRFFQKEGYKVFRYTGKELIEDPFQAACEVVEYLTDQRAGALYSYIEEFK